MKKNALLFLFLIVVSETSLSVIPPDSILRKCNTAKNELLLTENEKMLILLINVARAYPRYFYDVVLVPYLDSAKTNKKTKYYKSLKTDFYSMKALDPLVFQPEMYGITKAFAKDMGKKGRVGHVNSKHEALSDRFKNQSAIGENCSYGYNKPMDILVQLLLDEGVPSLGHRKNLLDSDYKYLAVAIYKHKRYSWNCVIDFFP